ncbi:carbon monoxide dehydrogenase subunit G [Pseudonocardia sulfidoxydans NBRC 16205]|uniref:Carbon monoxide dehydrogenase subunit G n=1 Tax=Pseudonocardia sulfidoxydans NBRC 16205 TaxID=1223511 RepID=A0A511DN91_9PSEU|nr:SRPBCC family protein [Pseudonocardia sulfidoxydans]GEL26296.1 carbon monoxide dehydrogenase subunit G [Pseudonocardia sulfidoxydans NBRC 16205]
MHLDHQFRVPLPVDQTWTILTDLPTVARCLPGAHLDSAVDGRYDGGLATRIGPISAKYRGTATFVELDEVDHRAVIEARGREEKGSGTATAVITMLLKPEGDSTLVEVTTELAISGRAAQFGRSLLADVSATMLTEFVRRLERMIAAGEHTAPAQTAAPAQGSATATAPAQIPAGAAADDDQLDAVRLVVLPMLKRAAGPLAGAAAGLLVGLVLGRSTGRRRHGEFHPRRSDS